MTDITNEFSSGPQWNNIVKRLSASTTDFSNLKRTSELMIFATFDPDRFGLAYLRTLIFHLYNNLDNDSKEILKNTQNRSLGNPYTARIGGEDIDLDYIQSAAEAAFIKPVIGNVSTVIEIGAGYGRTCHTIINNFKHIDRYCIIDLPYSIGLSSAYLALALPPDDFKKISFISTDDVASFFSTLVEQNVLFINIDSMAEMTAEVARNYLSLINRHGHYFFSKNAVGKYYPGDMGEKNVRREDYKDAIASGLIPEVINVFDLDEIDSRIDRYKEAYKPSGAWKLLRESGSDCYLHYYLALFEKSLP